jgi:hypothetical protein
MLIIKGDIKLEDKLKDMEEEDIELVDLKDEEREKERVLSRLIKEKIT